MTMIVTHGTRTLGGTLLPGFTLIADGGTPSAAGALLTVPGSYINDGAILLKGGHGVGAAGATLSDGGTLTNAGVLDVYVGRAGGAGAFVEVGGSLINDGTVTLQAGTGNSGSLQLDGGGVLTNRGVIQLESSQAVGRHGALLTDAGTFSNTGTILIATGGFYPGPDGLGATLAVSGILANAGTVEVGDHGSGRAAVLTISAAGVLQNTGLLLLGSSLYGGNIAAPDAKLIDAGVLTNSGTMTLLGGRAFGTGGTSAGSQLTLTGSLGNTGTLSLDGGYGGIYAKGIPLGATVFDRGTLTSGGNITVHAGYAGYGDQSGTGAVLIDSGMLSNTGTLSVLGTHGVYYGGPPSAGTLQITGVLNNSGTLDATGGDQVFFRNAAYGSQIQDGGTLVNTGVVSVGDGFDDYRVQYIGAFSATLDVTGVLINDSQLNGLAVPDGYGQGALMTIAAGGALTNDGTLSLAANAGHVYEYYGVAGATLSDSGRLGNAGSILIGGAGFGSAALLAVTATGVLHNGGAITARAGAGAYSVGGRPVPSYGGSIADAGMLTNSGIITLDGGGTAGSDMTVLSGGTLIDGGTIDGLGTIQNNGLILGGSVGRGLLETATFINDGSVQVSQGSTLQIGSALIATAGEAGRLLIGAGATLGLLDTVAQSQTATFAGAAATLALGDAQAFAGVLAGVQSDTTIDLLNQSALSATASGTALIIELRNGSTLSLTLAAPLAPGLMPDVGRDGSGGSDISFQSTTSASAVMDVGAHARAPDRGIHETLVFVLGH